MEITLRHIEKRINNPDLAIWPEKIVLHYIGNPGTTAAQNASWFATVKSQTSVNYVVDDESVIELIEPGKKTYGTSSKEANESSIQIEMCHPDKTGKPTEKTLENVIWLVQRLRNKFGPLEVIRHYDVTGKKCPRWYVEYPDEWEALKARIFKNYMTVGMAKNIIKERAGLSDETLLFLSFYKYGDDLLIKLARAMK